MADEKHFFIGIDLGTTNSSIHWGALNPATGRVEPRQLAFDQQTSDGTIQRRALLPSYLWFRQEEAMPVVGEYARSRGLEAQPSRVVWAVKNYMGRADWCFDVDHRSYSASQLSAILLQTMYAGIRKTWGKPVTDVVITVPASFDGDMRADTLEAAQLAGFKVLENDREPRNLLVDEPRAALYDFLNQQLAHHLPPGIRLDLASPKIVLVFDLGGGTLDVSLHRVKQSSDVDEIGVEDLAISRYTQLGGGVFDGLVADELQRQFEARHGIKLKDLPPRERHQVRIRLEIQAEQVKRRLTNDIERRLGQGLEEVPADFAVDVHLPFVFDNKGLFTRLSKEDFERAINPLLAPELTLEDVDRLERISDTDNVVYPILDVLNKARHKIGELKRVDAVLLNGGMTRVHAIRERLESLFGFQAIKVLDPEHAVSRGAAIYHYLLHRGWRPSQILAESIGVEVEDEERSRVFQLVPAGTVLPFQRRFVGQFFVPQENGTRLSIPLYRGEGMTPEPPNEKILERQFLFTRPQAKGTQIVVEIQVDENKMVHFTATLPDGESAEVKVGADKKSSGDSRASRAAPAPQTSPPLPTGPRIDPQVFRDRYKRLSASWDEPGLKQLGRQVLSARNNKELVKILIHEARLVPRPGKGRAMWVFGEYGAHYPDDPLLPRIIQECIQTVRRYRNNEKAMATVGRNAVVALGKIGSQAAESPLVNVLDDSKVLSIRSDILIALGKCGATHNAIQYVGKYLDSDRDGERISALWAMGRLGSRERDQRIRIEPLQGFLSIIGQRAFAQCEEHEIARKYAVYALGEIGDRRPTLGHRDVVDDAHAEYIVQVLDRVRGKLEETSSFSSSPELCQTQKLIGIALKQANGESLTEDENRMLMGVRYLMAVSDNGGDD